MMQGPRKSLVRGPCCPILNLDKTEQVMKIHKPKLTETRYQSFEASTVAERKIPETQQ
jgi:hypothetical protein